MAKPKKKVVVTTKSKERTERIRPTVSKKKKFSLGESANATGELLFNRESYLWMIIGIVVVALGMLLMVGGKMPDVNTWDPDLIYSTRTTLIAPIVILIGLIIEIYAIFKK